MSWFGGGLSNLQGKISSFTAQVLNEVAESVQGKFCHIQFNKFFSIR